MKNATELLKAYIAGSAEEAGALFASDGALELPYLADIGVQARYEGPEAITKFLTFLHQMYPGFVFENVQMHIETPKQAFGEYHINQKSAFSGKVVHQQFFGHLVAENGKIKLLREALNLIAAADGIFPNGLSDVVTNRAKVAS
jgi:uncharacterized protein